MEVYLLVLLFLSGVLGGYAPNKAPELPADVSGMETSWWRPGVSSVILTHFFSFAFFLCGSSSFVRKKPEILLQQQGVRGCSNLFI